MLMKASGLAQRFRMLGKCLALVGFVLTPPMLSISQCSANELVRGTRMMSTKAAERSDSNDCIVQISAFVQELDKLLASDPRTIHPVKDLIRRYFPVEGCDIQEAIRISRESRFFSHVSEEETYYVIAFDSRGLAGFLDPGFHVQINLLKASGNSWLPSANINQ